MLDTVFLAVITAMTGAVFTLMLAVVSSVAVTVLTVVAVVVLLVVMPVVTMTVAMTMTVTVMVVVTVVPMMKHPIQGDKGCHRADNIVCMVRLSRCTGQTCREQPGGEHCSEF